MCPVHSGKVSDRSDMAQFPKKDIVYHNVDGRILGARRLAPATNSPLHQKWLLVRNKKVATDYFSEKGPKKLGLVT